MFPRAGPCGLAQVTPACVGWEQWSERVAAWSVQQYVVRQEAVLSQENLRPIKLGMKYLLLCQSATTPADEMYQDFENPEHGKFCLGGQGPVIWT